VEMLQLVLLTICVNLYNRSRQSALV